MWRFLGYFLGNLDHSSVSPIHVNTFTGETEIHTELWKFLLYFGFQIKPQRPTGIMNRTFPKRRSLDSASFGSTVTLISKDEKDLCCGCTRRCACITAVLLIILMIVAGTITCAVVFGLPARTPESRYCLTPGNYTGFLCDDRTTCLLPSQVCNSASDCGNGEDESSSLCSNLPNNLPGNLIFRCGNPQFWIYSNLKCNGINNCGDCSDESETLASCNYCSSASWWTCSPILYQYCYCIPTTLCQNGAQDCVNWSDEYTCRK